MKPAIKILIMYLLLIFSGFILYSCTGDSQQQPGNDQPVAISNAEEEEEEEKEEEEETSEGESPYDNWKENKGIGPVTSLTLPAEIDQAMVAEGEKIYKEKCTSCHKPDKRFIGPSQKGVLERRTPEWVMNMILNPEQMVKEDPMAKQLLMDYNLSPMANQNLTEDDARKVLEYIRTL